MVRYFKIILLNFHKITQHRMRSFVWFFLSLFNPLLMLVFWTAVASSNHQVHLDLNQLSAYYLLLGGLSISSHVEEDVATLDIQEGGLTKYLLKPASYYWLKYGEELHYRILQTVYGITAILILSSFFHFPLTLSNSLPILLFGLLSCVIANLLSFTYKMLLALMAFWFTEIRGLMEFSEVLLIIFCGFIMPLDLLPTWLQTFLKLTPFPYMVYYPVSILIGKFNLISVLQIVGIQLAWVGLLAGVYLFTWKKGLNQYTAVGQ